MLTETDFTIQSELQSELLPGEKLLWAGRPRMGIVFRPIDVFLIPFSILWFGGMLFGFGAFLLANDTPKIALVFFIPFMAMGLFITVGRFWIDIRRRARTSYGISEKRVIIQSGLFSKNVQSINIKTLSDISIKEKADKSGTITFGPEDFRGMMASNMGMGFNKQSSRLEMINNVRQVYNQILQLQNG